MMNANEKNQAMIKRLEEAIQHLENQKKEHAEFIDQKIRAMETKIVEMSKLNA